MLSFRVSFEEKEKAEALALRLIRRYPYLSRSDVYRELIGFTDTGLVTPEMRGGLKMGDADQEVERLISQPAHEKPYRTPTSIIKSNAQKRDKFDEAIDNALTKGGLPVSDKNRESVRVMLEKLAEEESRKDE